jgi:hypothetical protein
MIPTIKLAILLNGYKIGVLEIPRSIANEYMPWIDTLVRLNDIPVYYLTITKKVLEDNPLVRLVYID